MINIARANFPAWLFCMVAGAALASINTSSPGVLVYLSLAVLMACLVYVLCFNRI